jgi:PP-loop superfamily ATP-utilizing enzyme
MNHENPRRERELETKKDSAVERLRSCGKVIVALSGGVDSAVLLALAVEALGRDGVLAVTGVRRHGCLAVAGSR